MEEEKSTGGIELSKPDGSLLKVAAVILTVALIGSVGYNISQFNSTDDLKTTNSQTENELTSLKTSKAQTDSQILTLNEQLTAATLKLAAFETSTLKFLTLQKESCDGDVESCVEKIISRPTEAGLTEAKGGMCVLRGNGDAPSEADANVGKGYAKLIKEGAFTASELQAACTKEDYSALLQAYCQQNSEKAQMAVLGVNEFGAVESSGCSKFGCGYVSCQK